MPTPRICVLRAPGTNCDPETAHAFEICGGNAESVHLLRVLEQPEMLKSAQILCIPGGFSYGDDIGSGVIFASRLRTHLAEAIREFLLADKLVLGICNGFQVLLKAGILPYGAESWSEGDRSSSDATLTWNANGKYTARWVRLKVGSPKSVFLRGMSEFDAPMAHAEGRIVVRDANVLDRWKSREQLAVTYTPWQQQRGRNMSPAPLNSARMPANPNGSEADLAGLCDPTGRVLGLMPHPERYLFGTQHPNWTRKESSEWGDGKQLFQNAVDYFR